MILIVALTMEFYIGILLKYDMKPMLRPYVI